MRIVLALAVAGAALVPASAQAIVQYCTPPSSVAGVCSMPERPGCVFGSVAHHSFRTPGCDG